MRAAGELKLQPAGRRWHWSAAMNPADFQLSRRVTGLELAALPAIGLVSAPMILADDFDCIASVSLDCLMISGGVFPTAVRGRRRGGRGTLLCLNPERIVRRQNRCVRPRNSRNRGEPLPPTPERGYHVGKAPHSSGPCARPA